MKPIKIIIRILLFLFLPFYLNISFYLIKVYLILGKLPDLYSTQASNLDIGFSVYVNVVLFFLLEFSLFSSIIIVLLSIFTKKLILSKSDYFIFVLNLLLHIFIINLGFFDIFMWAMG